MPRDSQTSDSLGKFLTDVSSHGVGQSWRYINDIMKSDCSLEKIYRAAGECYISKPKPKDDKEYVDLFRNVLGRMRPKLIENFLSEYDKDPNSEKSKILGLYSRELMVADFNYRRAYQIIKKIEAFAKQGAKLSIDKS